MKKLIGFLVSLFAFSFSYAAPTGPMLPYLSAPKGSTLIYERAFAASANGVEPAAYMEIFMFKPYWVHESTKKGPAAVMSIRLIQDGVISKLDEIYMLEGKGGDECEYLSGEIQTFNAKTKFVTKKPAEPWAYHYYFEKSRKFTASADLPSIMATEICRSLVPYFDAKYLEWVKEQTIKDKAERIQKNDGVDPLEED